MKLSDFDPGKVKSLLIDLKTEATRFVRKCDANSEILSEFKVYMRYIGQGWEIPITLTEAQAISPDGEIYQQLFEDDYSKLFGRPVEGMDVEVTVWAVNATTPPDSVARIVERPGESSAPIIGMRDIFDPALSTNVNANIVDRTALQIGSTVEGPAVIVEDETTIILPSSRTAVCQPDGCVDVIAKVVGD